MKTPSSNRPLYIFDLDGTIADIVHRRHLVECSPKKHREFYAMCTEDTPVFSVIKTMHRLVFGGADLWIWSGRSDEVLTETVRWLDKNYVPYHALKMREASDHQPDVKLKRSWLRAMDKEDRERLIAIFDDRKSVVDMWRQEGVSCFQVAEGDF